MTTAEFVNEVALASTGKEATYDNTSAKWSKIVAIGNRKLRQWAVERGVDWNSLYDPAYLVGNVTATDTFDLADEVRKISQNEDDPIRIYHTNGTSYTDYELTAPSKLKLHPYSNYLALINSRRIKFSSPFKSTYPQFGGKIYLPVYLYPDTFSGDNDDIVIDNPDWLVVITAAEVVRNDITRQGQYGNLISEANDLMESMKADNDSQDTRIETSWNPLSHNDETPRTTRLS